MRQISLLLILGFIVFPGFAQEQMKPQDDKSEKTLDLGCLPREWAEINPTETEKLFDVENDLDKYGVRISCMGHSTPTELNKFFKKVKDATKTEDREALADLIKFPISSLIDGEYEDKLNNRTIINSMVIKDRRDFIDNYENIMLPTTVKIIQCMSLKNIFVHFSQGIATEAGEIWFYPKRGTRELQIIRLSSSPEADKHWLDKKCSW
ncbi:MAG: hypothetical protein KDF58_00420 [Alphaproteobacteria bacterium]|nr:hypothetical protein [Alphaproteobacteria bacterium]